MTMSVFAFSYAVVYKSFSDPNPELLMYGGVLHLPDNGDVIRIFCHVAEDVP